MSEMKKNKPVEILTIKVIIDETSISTAKERKLFSLVILITYQVVKFTIQK